MTQDKSETADKPLFDRVFSRPDISPYSEVEWSQRDAEITDDSGKPIFKQSGVQVPASWSMLATKVVVSKYFYGEQGTAEREQSVGQLVHRVCRTIADWGVKDGYFTKEEGEVFYAELSWLCLNQHLAFNSPVWFNVGLYHQYGIGKNSGEGNWFTNRETKIAERAKTQYEFPQASACLPYHALVNTVKGLIPIGKIVQDRMVGLSVFDGKSTAKVQAVKANGFKEVFKLNLNDGRFIEATADHLVLVHAQRKTGKGTWKRVDQVKLGDHVQVHPFTVAGKMEIVSPAVVRYQKVESVEPCGLQEVFDIQTSSSQFLTNGVVVHNCFIQSVDDNMEDIMRLAYSEAMLFKFGSGTGTDLSTIRSSKEKLSGGGRPSGPLSFLRIYDQVANVVKSGGKCLAPHQLVFTELGPIPVKQLAESEKDFVVLSYDPPAGRVKAKWARAWKSGRKQVVRVKTDKGQFDVSWDHPMKLADGQVKKASHLLIGQRLFACNTSPHTFNKGRNGETTESGYAYIKGTGLAGRTLVHRLIAEDLVGLVEGKVVHHIDEDTNNNHPLNLRVYESQSEHAKLHNAKLVEDGLHPFQLQKFDTSGQKNGMHISAPFHQDAEKVQQWKNRLSVQSVKYAKKAQGFAVKQRMLNNLWELINNGIDVSDFDKYNRAMDLHFSRGSSKKQRQERIDKHFGSYEMFVQEASVNNHCVESVEQLGEMDVYSVEVDCPTADDKSPQSGHTYTICAPGSTFRESAGVIVMNTRRAAKMNTLKDWHGDIEEFIDCKQKEEKKAWALIEQGYNGSFNGDAYGSVAYQNENLSVRVSDEFMDAALNDREWWTKAVTNGKPIEKKSAKTLLDKIAEGTHICGDPGIQFDGAIQKWHTCKGTEPIHSTNPCCFTGDTYVLTTQGCMTFEQLHQLSEDDMPAAVCYDIAGQKFAEKHIRKVWVSGQTRRLVKVTLSNKTSVVCTPDHRFILEDGTNCPAKDLLGKRVVAKAYARTIVEATSVEPVQQNFPVNVFDMEVDTHHNFLVAGEEGQNPVVVHNSEYVFLNNTACNLASLNLMKFKDQDGRFNHERFKAAVRIAITAQEILVDNASYPTKMIAENSHIFRTLGLGYANLGCLLMSYGLPYDSDEGRSLAGAITAIMTGEAYAQSARMSKRMGPFPGFHDARCSHVREPLIPSNRDSMLEVIQQHSNAVNDIQPRGNRAIGELISVAAGTWSEAYELGKNHGYRNAQVTVLAPTGCLVESTLVQTGQGLVRLGQLGNKLGNQWQETEFKVQTDEGPKTATKFYLNGMKPTRLVETEHGFVIQGTGNHQVKVVGTNGKFVWKRLDSLSEGDLIPMRLGGMFGNPVEVPLQAIGSLHGNCSEIKFPSRVNEDLAELLGYFMGDGSLHEKGVRFAIDRQDQDVVCRIQKLIHQLFGLEGKFSDKFEGEVDCVYANSVPLRDWFELNGLNKHKPSSAHTGKGWVSHIPDCVLQTNDPAIYRAFLRGLFEADGSGLGQHVSTKDTEFANDIQTMALSLGLVLKRRGCQSGFGGIVWQLRLANSYYAEKFLNEVGFVSSRKSQNVARCSQPPRNDSIPFTDSEFDQMAELVPPVFRRVVWTAKSRGKISRAQTEVLTKNGASSVIGNKLDYFYSAVEVNLDGGERFTYDISVPENVTYMANGMISHNTIAFMMDCDTTGVEPDIALVKYKLLAGGGMLKIVNKSIEDALNNLGYDAETTSKIMAHVHKHDTIEDVGDEKSGLNPSHLAIFDCAFKAKLGTRSIDYMAHLKMMAAAQPSISGAISKCVTGDTLITSEKGLIRIQDLYNNELPDTMTPISLKVSSSQGVQTATNFYYGGKRDVTKIELRNGQQIVGTPNHRVMVAGNTGLEWKYLRDIQEGDYVACKYGSNLWNPNLFLLNQFTPSPKYGNQKSVLIPSEFNSELAFLIGSYMAEGHAAHSVWTITIANSNINVLERLKDAFKNQFGIQAKIQIPGPDDLDPAGNRRCPCVVAASKTVVEFLEFLGCGFHSSTKRIPAAVFQSPKSVVLSFLEGMFLDAAVLKGSWAICLNSKDLIADIQALLTNLGVVTSYNKVWNKKYKKFYHKLHAHSTEAQKLLKLVYPPETNKAAAADKLLAKMFSSFTNSSDVIPNLRPSYVRSLFPKIKSGKAGKFEKGPRRKNFASIYINDKHNLKRSTVKRILDAGISLPEWVKIVFEENIHFSPVRSVVSGLKARVYDLSIPTTEAFVGNGIINHNTVNMPKDATIQDIKDAYVQAWKMGLKCVAIYRDGSKRSQPLNTSKEGASDDTTKKATELQQKLDDLTAKLATAGLRIVDLEKHVAKRRKLPDTRPSITHKFDIAGHQGYLTVGLFEDGQPGELFVSIAKEGSTIGGLMDAVGVLTSIALQYGVPLETLVKKFSFQRFEPSGFTKNPNIRNAASIIDYVFRWMQSEFIKPAAPEDSSSQEISYTITQLPKPNQEISYAGEALLKPAAVAAIKKPATLSESVSHFQEDAPCCSNCGHITVRNGSCYRCLSCGESMGCS